MKRKYIWPIYLILPFIVVSFFCLQFAGHIYAMTLNSKTDTNTRQISVHKPHVPVSFIAWKGNRLMTTAGTFIIDHSVEVIDKAGSRHLSNKFKGSPPSVKLFFNNRKLIKVIIK